MRENLIRWCHSKPIPIIFLIHLVVLMKTRYYLSMLSIVLMTISVDLVIYFTSNLPAIYSSRGEYDPDFIFFGWFGSNLFIFVVVNLVGSVFIFKPIQTILSSNGDISLISNNVQRLPVVSAIWVISIGAFYTAFVLTTMWENLVDPIMATYYTFICLYTYSIITGFCVYFVVNDYADRLKKKIYEDYNYIFPCGNGKIWHKLTLVFVIISFLPISIMIFDNLIAKHFQVDVQVIDSQKMVFVDGVCSLIGIIVAIYFVTKRFTRPMSLLIKSIRKVHKGDLTIVTPVVSNDETSILTHEFNSMVKGLKEREFIRDTLGKYISEEVANLVLNQKMQLKGELRLATILITDIANYTTLSETQSPDAIVNMLNEYFSQVLGIIVRYNGIVNKFIGDSVFALFNVPVADQNHAQNAIQSAIEIQNLIEKQIFPNDTELSTRIGINTGMVVAGNIGSKERMEYTVIGDEVNVAARLEQLNKQFKSKIIVGPQTYELAKNHFNFEPMGSIKVKGRSQAVDAYKVVI